MKRAELEKAVRYFNDQILLMKGGNVYSEPLPHMQAALVACCKALDELDRQDVEREKAIVFFREEVKRYENAPAVNGHEMTPEWAEEMSICKTAIEALEEMRNE